MSFEEIKAEIEAVVIQPLLDFRGKTSPLNHIHNENTQDFSNIMSGLLTGSDGETAFQGDGSMALADLVGNYIRGEQSITGSGTDFVGHLLEAAQDSERTAHQLQQQLDSIAAQQDQIVQDASAIALGLDAGAVAQGGIDLPWDAVAAGATLIAMGIAATHNADQEKSQQAQMAKYTAIVEWSKEINGIAGEPLTQLPPSPTNANAGSSGFLKLIGLGILLATTNNNGGTSGDSGNTQSGNSGGGSGASSMNDIFADPGVLENMTPEQLEALARAEGWQIDTLRRGSHAGQGLIVREVDKNGKLTGRIVQWHPGGGHHGSKPYWKISSPSTGTIRVGL